MKSEYITIKYTNKKWSFLSVLRNIMSFSLDIGCGFYKKLKISYDGCVLKHYATRQTTCNWVKIILEINMF